MNSSHYIPPNGLASPSSEQAYANEDAALGIRPSVRQLGCLEARPATYDASRPTWELLGRPELKVTESPNTGEAMSDVPTIQKSCVKCIHAGGIRASADDPFSYYCHWLEHVLPPPLVDAIEARLETGGPPFIEDEDYELNAEICPHYDEKSP